jgi:hypothetical protein
MACAKEWMRFADACMPIGNAFNRSTRTDVIMLLLPTLLAQQASSVHGDTS